MCGCKLVVAGNCMRTWWPKHGTHDVTAADALGDGHWLAGLVAALGQLKLRTAAEQAKLTF
jgi:hypothetical protein